MRYGGGGEEEEKEKKRRKRKKRKEKKKGLVRRVCVLFRHCWREVGSAMQASGDLGLQEAQSRSEQRIEAFSLASNTEGGGGGGSSGSGGGDDSAAGLEAVAAIKGSQIKEVFGEGTSLADAAEAAGNAMALPGTHSFDR